MDEGGGQLDGAGRRPGDICCRDLDGKGQAVLDLAITNEMGRNCVKAAAERKGSRLIWHEDYKRNYKTARGGTGKTTE